MLAARCPKCGAPTPVSAAAPDHMDCAYCAYVGPPPAEVQADLRAAAAVLGRMTSRRRQLTRFQQRALGRMGCSSVLYFALLAAMALPFAISAAACTAIRDEMDTWALVVVGFGPLLVVLASGAFGWWWMRRSRAALSLACAAQPPAARGRPACCRVCGGELTPRAGSVVARCRFCRADNVVSQAAMQRRWSEQEVVLGGYEHAVRARAEAAGSTSLYAKLLVFFAAIGAPIIVAVVAFVIVIVLALHEEPADASQQYVAVATPEGKCLALLQRYPGGVQAYDFGNTAPAGVAVRARFAAGAMKPIAVKQLRGLTLLGKDGLPRAVERVYRTSLDEHENWVELASREGEIGQSRAVVGSCLAGDKPPARVLEFKDHGDPLLVARAGDGLVIGFSDALYSVGGNHRLQQLWKTTGTARALAMLADDHAVYAELGKQVLAVEPDGKLTVLAQMPAHLGRGIAVDGHALYFAGEGGVARVDRSGGKVETALDGAVAQALAASGGALALIDPHGDALVRAANAAKPITLGHDATAEHGIAIAGGRVFWTTKQGALVSAPLAGGATKQHGTLDGIDAAFVIHGDAAWWTRTRDHNTRGALLSRPLAGGAFVDHSPGAKSVDAFGFDGADLYWLDARRRWLMRRRL